MDKKEKKSNKLIFAVIGLLAIAAITTAVVLISGFTTVTFDTDGGNKIASVRVRKGKPVAQPEDPVKEEFDFTGWYLNDQPYDFNTPVNEPITLKAHWSPSKYVTFVVNGEVIDKVHIVDGHVSFPEAPYVKDYTLDKWVDKDNNEADENTVFTDDTTLTALYRPYVEITSIMFGDMNYTVERDGTVQSVLLITPTNWAENLKYTIDDEKIAKVDSNGLVTGLAAGTTRLRVKTESGLSADCGINVIVSIKSLSFTKSSITMNKGDKMNAGLKVNPEDTTETIKYYSNDENVVKVDQNGNLTAVGAGTAIITASGKTQVASLNVTVIVPATGIDVNTKLTLDQGSTVNLGAKLIPADSTSKLSYSSSDTIVATVDNKGNVYGREGGHCVITIKTDNNITKKVDVYVDEYTLVVSLNGPNNSAIYLYYTPDDPQGRPIYLMEAELRITKNGEDKFYAVDLKKVEIQNNDKNFNYYNGELYATSYATVQNGMLRAYSKDIYFTYEYNGKTVKSGEFEVNIETALDITVSPNTITYDRTKKEIHLPTQSGQIDFTVMANQPVSYTPSSNLTVVKYSENKPNGQPIWANLDLRYTKTASSSPASLILTTPGGQRLEIKYIR